MLYVWIDNGVIVGTDNPETIPQGVEYFIFEDLDLSDITSLKIENGRIVKKTDEEILNELKQRQLYRLKSIVSPLLSQTDYIILKIQEAQILNQDLSPLLQKYQKQIQWRESLRKWNEQKKMEITNAQSKEELESISLDDYPRMEA